MPEVSVVCLTLGREKQALETLSYNLSITGMDEFEVLICDQGTENDIFKAHLKALPKVSYFRENKHNEGVSRALNQLILRRRGRHVFFMPDDIVLPIHWMKELYWHAENVNKAGIIGFEGQDLVLPPIEVSLKDGSKKIVCMKPATNFPEEGTQVFGATMMTESLLNAIGAYHEGYHPYGLEDSDYCFRCFLSGHYCFYIPGLKSKHIGVDENVGDLSSKQFCYWSNLGYHRMRCVNYHRLGLFEPWPILKEPLL